MATPRASAQQDYSVGDHAWNGLDRLIEVAASRGVDLRTSRRVDVDALTGRDALMIVYPTTPPPARSIGAFLRRGGRLALADDYGSGSELLARYQITREAAASDAPAYRGQPGLLIARGDGNHPLSRGVSALVTNHPVQLHHDSLPAIFFLGSRDQALVLTGVVGEGRFVALGDPSLLINNMLEFRGNQHFAANLMSFLSAGRGGLVYLVTPETELVGVDSERSSAGFGDWRRRLDEAQVPAAAMRVLSVLFLALVLIVGLSALPRRSPYRVDKLLPQALFGGGYAGHLAFFTARRRNLLYPAIAYKVELEQALVARLELASHPLLRDVVEALRQHQMPEPEVARLRSLLLELDELARLEDLPPGPPKVSRRDLRRMVNTGEGALAWLESNLEAT